MIFHKPKGHHDMLKAGVVPFSVSDPGIATGL